MPRPLEFEPEIVLEKAMHVFWEKGVEHTSIRDLVEATDVQRSGLYNVFENKEGLFRQSFELYIQRVVKKNFAHFFAHPDADIEDIKRYFDHFNEIVDQPVSSRGCLMCNTASSNALEAQIVDASILDMFAEIQGYFRKALRNSREKKMISTPVPDEELAAAFLGSVIGLSNMCRSPNGRPLVRSYVAELLRRITAY